jgi:predicted enzyme related to lactoylglutathione lyase
MGNPQGVFGWVDLGTTDQKAAKKFYGSLFGWKYNDQDLPQGGSYSMAHRDGKQIAGIGTAQEGMPPVWSSYIMVDSVDKAADQVTGLGGKVLMPPIDVLDSGRMAFISDPTGAAVGLWQAAKHGGADLFNEPGTMTWNELATRGVDKALPFYQELLGWSWKAMEGSPTPYHMANLAERPVAGAMEMNEVWPVDVPPHWDVYFSVEDADKSVAKVEKLGGKNLAGPIDVPTVGRIYMIADPQGASLYIMTPEPRS